MIVSYKTTLVTSKLRALLASGVLVASLAPMGCLATVPGETDAEADGDLAETSEALVLPNLALGKYTDQSSTYTGSLASAVSGSAVDGNTDGNFGGGSVTHTNNEAGAWWQVDLGSAQRVGNVVLWNRTDCCSDRLSNFDLIVSDDNINWQWYGYPGVAPAQVTFAVNRTARYVKVRLRGTNPLSLAEVQVFARSPAVPVMGNAYCNDTVQLKSWKGDYLHRPDSAQGVTTWTGGGASLWTLRCDTSGKIGLESWKGDYLHRPDSAQGVTTWTSGGASLWTVVPASGANVMLRSWKGDYLHRPDSAQGVTTWDHGEWTVEVAVPPALTKFPIAITANVNQRYVTAENGGASSLIANRTSVGPWEGFQVVDLGGGNVAIKSTFNGLYVTAENAGSSPLIANRSQVGPWETFRFVSLENNDFALRAAANGLYVSALSAGGSPLQAAGLTADAWEMFHWQSIPDATLPSKFAPRLHFDSAAPNFPMSAQDFRSNNSSGNTTDYATIVNHPPPTYYQVVTCGAQTRIMYWWFYGYQNTCDGIWGSHNGDWEKVMVTLAEDKQSVAAVTYWLHGDHYTRITARGGVEIEGGTHPVVHVGKTSHASYYNQGGSGSCLLWEDFHNDGNATMDSSNNLVSLDTNAEPWMLADRQGGSAWGPGGVNTHPTTEGPSCYVQAASWGEAHWGTQCKPGDSDSGVECLQQCASGYTNGGLICTNWSTWASYARNRYSYQYDVPTSNLGLTVEDY